MAKSRKLSAATPRPRSRALALAAAWLAVSLTSVPGAADELAQGAELYELCAQCHGAAGEGMPLSMAPAIAGLKPWYVTAQLTKFRDGLRGMHPDDVGGMRMYPMSLTLKSDEDLKAVTAYVASLPTPRPERLLEGGDAARGKQLYAPCTACHGVDGAGNEVLNAPGLTHASDWYLLSSLQKYKAGVRGSNPKNTNAQIMRGMAAILSDEQAMKDVIAFISTLSPDDKSQN